APHLAPPCRFSTKHGLVDIVLKGLVRTLDRAPGSRASGVVAAVSMSSRHGLSLGRFLHCQWATQESGRWPGPRGRCHVRGKLASVLTQTPEEGRPGVLPG